MRQGCTLTESGSLADVILTPRVNTRVHWPVTVKNSLNLSLGLGYSYYVNHSQYGYLMLAPGSQLSFDLYVKDFRITFFDRFTYTQDPLQNGAVSGVGNYGGFDNSVGVNADWDLDKLIVSAGYAHQNFIPSQAEFDYLTRASELFYAHAAFLLSQTWSVGPEASSGLTTYNLTYMNHALSFSAGAFSELKLTPHLNINAHAGFVGYNFTSQQATGVSEEPRSYYFSLNIDHTLNQSVTHSLQAGRGLTLGTYSDFQELFYVRYGLTWTLIRHVGLGGQLFYEHGSYPALTQPIPGAPQYALGGSTYDRYGAALTLSYLLMEKLTTSLAYRFTLKDSNPQSLSYTQNALTLGLTYQF